MSTVRSFTVDHSFVLDEEYPLFTVLKIKGLSVFLITNLLTTTLTIRKFHKTIEERCRPETMKIVGLPRPLKTVLMEFSYYISYMYLQSRDRYILSIFYTIGTYTVFHFQCLSQDCRPK